MKLTETKWRRCLNCKTQVDDDLEICKCGDRLKPKEAPVPTLDPAPDAAALHASGTGLTTRFESARPVPTKPPIELTTQQRDAVAAVSEWFEHDNIRPFRLFGPAGTGKTTIVRYIADALGVSAVYGAYTGKAASVLRKKGVDATTIHSAIYRPTGNREVKAELEEAQRELANYEAHRADPIAAGWANALELAGAIDEAAEQIAELEATLRRPGFTLNPESEWAYAELIVLDEVSMVNARMGADIESFGVPVLVLGDPAQLPPVEGGGHYTADGPDFLLDEVHRQALDSPVLALATDIRKGVSWMDQVVPVNLAEAMRADQILVWKNDTRWSLVNAIRTKKDHPAGEPVPGDRVMCLVNNRDAGVLNGQQFEVLAARRDDLGFEISARDDEGHVRELQVFSQGFGGLDLEMKAKKDLGAWRGRRALFTFADAITVHKAQGSEWPDVYVVDQTSQMWKSSAAEKRAWIYTAVTRASQSVTIARTGLK